MNFGVFFDLNQQLDNGDAGDLRCRRAHYGAAVMVLDGFESPSRIRSYNDAVNVASETSRHLDCYSIWERVNYAITGSDKGYAPTSHHNQRWFSLTWTFGNIVQWNVDLSSNIFSQEDALNMPSAKRPPFCININVVQWYEMSLSCMWIGGDSLYIVYSV